MHHVLSKQAPGDDACQWSDNISSHSVVTRCSFPWGPGKWHFLEGSLDSLLDRDRFFYHRGFWAQKGALLWLPWLFQLPPGNVVGREAAFPDTIQLPKPVTPPQCSCSLAWPRGHGRSLQPAPNSSPEQNPLQWMVMRATRAGVVNKSVTS